MKHEIEVSTDVVEICCTLGAYTDKEIDLLHEKTHKLSNLMKSNYSWGDVSITTEKSARKSLFFGKEATYYMLTFVCPIDKKEKAIKAIEEFLS